MWYEAKTGNHQGLIVDEDTGKNIAVAYDKADAPLIAAAPRMREALEAAEHWLEEEAYQKSPTRPVEILRVIREALRSASCQFENTPGMFRVCRKCDRPRDQHEGY